MKKFIIFSLFTLIALSLFSQEYNVKQIDQLEIINTEITISATPHGVTRIISNKGDFSLSEQDLNKLQEFISEHIELIDIVKSNNLTVVYRRQTGRMITYKGTKNLSFSFYSPGTGAENCIITIRIINNTTHTTSQLSFNGNQILRFNELLKESLSTIKDTSNQITMLNEKVKEIRKMY